jgi:hypothetical protein
MRQGYDYSNWNGSLPANPPGEFAYLLFNDGTGFTNPNLAEQVAALRNAGIPFGGYLFLEPGEPVAGQVALFLHLCEQYRPTLPGALDVEKQGPLSWLSLGAMVIQASNLIAGQGMPYPLAYMNISFYDSLMASALKNEIWLADPSHQTPSRPCLIWQQAPRSVPGLTGLTDPDLFLGTNTEWQPFTGTPIPTPVHPTEVAQMITNQLSFKSGQIDYLWISAGIFWHSWSGDSGNTWHSEVLIGPGSVAGNIGSTIPNQTICYSQVNGANTTCVVPGIGKPIRLVQPVTGAGQDTWGASVVG